MTKRSYDWWENALAEKNAGRPVPPPPSIDEPEPGYFRMSGGPGNDPVPVAFWYEPDDSLVTLIGNKRQDDLAGRRAWPYAAKTPVDYDVYLNAKNGKGWPDGAPPKVDTPQIGDNSKNAPPEHEVFGDEVDSAVKTAAAFKEVTSDAQAAQAQSARARCNELAGAAEKKRKALNEPYRKLVEGINTLWKPLGDRAKAEADRIAGLIGAWETKKAAAERARLAAEQQKAVQAAATAQAAGQIEPLVPDPMPPTPPTPAPATQVRGSYGRAAGVKVVHTIKSYDLAKLFERYKAVPEVVSLLVKLAQKDVDNGHTVEGVVTEEERKVK